MLCIDLTGKRCLIAGIADSRGFGFAIAQHLVEAGATVCAAVWPPAHAGFETMQRLKKFRKLGREDQALEFERVYALDARYDDPSSVPTELRENRRYRDVGGFTTHDLALAIKADFDDAQPLDIVVHCIANAPELNNALLDTSRAGYLEAISASSYSLVSLLRYLAPLMRPGGSALSMSYIAAERVVPGYGGGMSSAKAALESDTRVLAFELGRRHGIRVNCISAGPYASRAASATGFIQVMVDHVAQNSPIPTQIEASDVGSMAAFLVSPLARAVTGTTVYVDQGSHCMGVFADAARQL